MCTIRGLKIYSPYILFISSAFFTQCKNTNNFKPLHRYGIPGASFFSYKLVQKSKTPFHLLSGNQERLLFEQGTEQEFSFIAVSTLCLVCSIFEFVPTLKKLCTKIFRTIPS